ncbi:MAG: two-component regulator propeller domain-containing protein [Paludibacter sp.]
MKRFSIIIALSFLCQLLTSQTIPQVTHYSMDNGLSENHILCMLQDRKGVMWFGTFDGLNRFDGYTFSNYKGGENQKYRLLNFRVDQLKQDKWGFLWLLTNDNRFYRFNPVNEKFLPVPQFDSGFQNFKKALSQISIMPDGTVWLYNREAGVSDCFRVESNTLTEGIRVTHFCIPNKSPYVDKINKIYLDRSGNTWILTSNGAYMAKKNSNKLVKILSDKTGDAFFSIIECSLGTVVGGENGKIWTINKYNRPINSAVVSKSFNIVDFQKLNNDELLVITNKWAFYIYQLSSGLFREISCNELRQNTVFGSYKDKTGNIWINTDNPGGVLFETNLRSFRYFPVDTTKYINRQSVDPMVKEDKFANIWVLTNKGGFYKYNQKQKLLEPISERGDDKISITNINYQGIVDQQGNLWINTYLHGIDKIVFRHSHFAFTKPFDCEFYDSKNDIRTLFEDSRKLLWVASKNGLVYIYDRERKLLGLLGADGRLNNKKPFESQVYSICEDHTGAIWLGTKKKGLYRLDRPLEKNCTVDNWTKNKTVQYNISSNSIYSIFEDHLQRLWIGTFGGGLNQVDKSGGKIRFLNKYNELKNYPLPDCNRVRFITEDRNFNILIGTAQGLLVFKADKLAPDKIKFQLFTHNPNSISSLPGSDVHYVFEHKNGDIYLSTIGGGVCVINGGIKSGITPVFRPLKSADGRTINSVYTIKTDHKNNLWMSTETQVVRYNPVSKKMDTYKPVTTGNYFFDEAAVCQTSRGDLMYGTSNGFLTFKPSRIQKSNFIPSICFTQFYLFNKVVNVGAADSLLHKTIDETPELTLTSEQNTFSIEYAAIDHANPYAIQYAYKMDGLEKGWNYVDNQRIATYTNLPKGEYIFRVKSTNADGEWVNNEKTIVIVKLPSFWESAWGVFFYFVSFIVLSVVVAYILFVIYKLRNEIDLEQRISNMKLRFFTDISHELRTPLTLIASPVDNLMRNEPLSDQGREQLQMVQRNTDRMLRLINQILDFRKIQNKKMKLVIEVIRVTDFLEEIRMSFLNSSDEKKIKLHISDHSNNAQLCVDKDKFEKIFFNLISNAFKFSPAENKIDIIITENTENVTITVQDRGMGISQEKLKFLFNRFESFALSNNLLSNNLSFQASTGIGLSLTKELVELHKATIEVESEIGKGSAFKVKFRKGVKHFDQNEEFLMRDLDTIDNNPERTTIFNATKKEMEIETRPDKKLTNELLKILVVEDNSELRAFLKLALISDYDVHEAENGFSALDMIRTHSFDIIISDIMMPDMDGLELTRELKYDINTSHIPLILLTAKTDLESKLEALELGADDYITKPFSTSYLISRIENLVKTRLQLLDHLKSTLACGVIALSKPELTNMDEIFLKKTITFMEENYENPDMNVDDIALSTGMSRSSYFKKIKSLTGLAPGDFIREFRIQKSIQLMEGGETNISQIAYSVGINDIRYFRKWFKQKCGLNPSEYIAQKTNKD